MGTRRIEHRLPFDTFLDTERLPGKKGSDDEDYMDSKWAKPMTFRSRVRAGKGRAKNMAMGAASVISRWPDHLLLCWLACIAFVMFTVACVLMVTTLTKTPSDSALNYQEHCVLRNTHAAKKDMGSKTNIYLHVIVNDDEIFDPRHYKTALTSTVKHHPNFKLNVLVLFNDMNEDDYHRNTRFRNWEQYHRGMGKYSFFDTSSGDIDDDVTVTLVDISDEKGFDNNENIHVIQSTFSNYFKHSPLRNVWRSLPLDLIPVSMRILSLWEHGGITLPWNMFLDKTNIYCENRSDNSRLRNLVAELKKNFSQSYVSPLDQAQVKKDKIDELKNEFRDFSAEPGLDFSATSEIKRAFKNLKASLPQDIHNYYNKKMLDIEDSRPNMFLTTSEEEMLQYDDEGLPSSLMDGDSSLYYYYSSYYYSDEYYSDYTYSDYSESDDGLPSSMESASYELRLRPDTPEHVNDEIKRFVGRKISGYYNGRVPNSLQKVRRRSLLSYLSDSESGENSSESRDDSPSSEASSESNESSASDELERLARLLGISKSISSSTSSKTSESSDSSDSGESQSDEFLKLQLLYKRTPPSDNIAIHQSLDDSHFFNGGKVIKDPFDDLNDEDSSMDEGMQRIKDALRKLPVLQKPLLDFQQDSERSLSSESDYYSNYYSDSSSGYLSTSDSDENYSLEYLHRILKPVSEVLRRPEFKIKEPTGYKEVEAFDNLNIFSLPTKKTVTFDHAGYYFSTRDPCHVFLGQLISLLQNQSFKSPDELVAKGLNLFCKNQRMAQCNGVNLL